jgi:hypothetical protein
LDKDVAPVAICMHKVIFHEHLEKELGAQLSDDLIERVLIELEVGNWPALDKGFDEHHLFRIFCDWQGEFELLAAFEHLVEGIEVSHFKGEVNLLDKGPLERGVANGDLIGRRNERSEVANKEEDIDIPLDIDVHIWMSHLYSYLLPLVPGLVDLAH